MDQIYFNNNSLQIKVEDVMILNKIAVLMTQFSKIQLLVCSHTNCTNKNDYDLWLLKRMARLILEYMTDNGIKASRLSFDGFGKEEAQNLLCINRECSKLDSYEKGRLEFIVKWL